MKKTFKKGIKKASNKSTTIRVVILCSVCGEPVCATKKHLAYRHGFERYRKKRITTSSMEDVFSQEDNTPCAGSGQAVVYKRKFDK